MFISDKCAACDTATTMPADQELSSVLQRRQSINDALDEGKEIKPKLKVNVFAEFSRAELRQFEQTFKKFDLGGDGFLDLLEMKLMMERLGAPQTHLGLKKMISEVDEDQDGKISFKEFLMIYRKARAGELTEESLKRLAVLTEINVEEVGVYGAKEFFEAKIEQLRRGSQFEDEIRREKERKQREEEERERRRIDFKEKAAMFQNGGPRMVAVNNNNN